MVTSKRKCIDCGRDISKRGNRADRCEKCQSKFRKKYKERWDLKNRPTEHGENYNKLGNPMQDDYILDFIQKKRMGKKTKKYSALPDDAFN